MEQQRQRKTQRRMPLKPKPLLKNKRLLMLKPPPHRLRRPLKPRVKLHLLRENPQLRDPSKLRQLSLHRSSQCRMQVLLLRIQLPLPEKLLELPQMLPETLLELPLTSLELSEELLLIQDLRPPDPLRMEQELPLVELLELPEMSVVKALTLERTL